MKKIIIILILFLFLPVSSVSASSSTIKTSTATISVSVDNLTNVSIDKEQSISQLFIDIIGGKSNDPKLKILDPKEKILLEQNITEDTNIPLKNKMSVPGEYKVNINNQEVTKFLWGVLVINTNKDNYSINEKAYIQIASLDKNGHTLCDSNLELTIDNQTILVQKNNSCGVDNVTDSPDYFAYYNINSSGVKEITLKNLDNNYEVISSLKVNDDNLFTIERIGATRINPFKADYAMNLKITPRKNFKGVIQETLPSDFKLVDTPAKWSVDLQAGKTYDLTYTYDAPNLSPEIFFLGPLTIGNYSESRQWQLASDTTFQMQTGYYIGDGADNRAITGVGFQPELLLIKDDTANGSYGIVWKSSSMSSEVTALLGESAADIATDAIQSLDSNGFTLGTNADVNGANVRFTWVAFRGSDCTSSGTFCVGSYTGDGTSPRSLTTVGFQPNMVAVKRSGANIGVFRTSSMPTNVSQIFDGQNEETTGLFIRTLDSTGFTIGSASPVNTASNTYWFFAFKSTANAFAVGTYTGDGLDNKTITGVGFQPQYVWVKISNATSARRLNFNLTESYGDYAGAANDNVNAVDNIQSLDSDGFTVGTAPAVNESGKTIYWVAFAGATNPTANGTYTMKVGSYTGNGTTQSLTGVGFAPDLVIIKDGSGANYGVFRTKLMKSDATAYFGGNSLVNFTGGITSMDSDGFSVGAGVTVNTNTTVYHYQAFGNAFNPEDNTGAADFAIGAHTGNLVDDRNIVRVPFQPDLVAIKANAAVNGLFRTSAQSGDLSAFFHGAAEAANYIQALNSDGFQVGSVGQVNSDGNIVNWFAFKASSTMGVNNYTGTGSAQNITAVGFNPDMVWVKSAGSGAGVSRSSVIVGDSTLYFTNTAAATDRITGFLSNGFSIGGNQVQTNTSGTTYRYAAWKITNASNTKFKGLNLKGLNLK